MACDASAPPLASVLSPRHGLLFRITHVANLPWLLQHGLHAANGVLADPSFIPIGNPNLIGKRRQRRVPIPPGGTLSDYVPFYFTPRSPMLFNIKTGWNDIPKRSNEDIVILISSCKIAESRGVTMLYTDRHAYEANAAWMSDQADLITAIDWNILRRHDFSRDSKYPDKKNRYQAEALAYRHIPAEALRGIACVSCVVRPGIEATVREAGSAVPVFIRPEWYFP